MKPIIQEIAEIISDKFTEELQRLFTEARDTSEFIIAIKSMLDGVGTRLATEALETLDQAVKDSPDRKRNWVVKIKETLRI
ncbi:MAG: hypothetical protein H5T98_07585 [Syntrophomonadaceae bacterium]|nr:hypothetical protein [Syntrophomonadaceae bacterium]